MPISSIYTDYSALPLRSQVCIDGREVSSMPEGKGRRRREGEVRREVKIHYIYRLPAWLAIHPELQVISSLPRPPSSSQHSTCSVCWKRNDYKTQKAYNWTKHQTENDKTHTRRITLNPSPHAPVPYIFSFPLPARETSLNMPRSGKTQKIWIEQKTEQKLNRVISAKDF